MKTGFALVVVAALSSVTTFVIVSHHLAARHAEDLAQRKAIWATEKAALEDALSAAPPPQARPEALPAPAPAAVIPVTATPAEILQRLTKLRIAGGADRIRHTRQAIKLFEDLAGAGPEALPAIRAFLERLEDIEYEAEGKDLLRGLKEGRLVTEFVVPPSLRLGLLDVVRQIGGEPAERLLAETLSTTGRAVEVAYLARVLQDQTPDKYRDLALSVARDLLVNPPVNAQPNRLDKGDRDFLFAVLGMYSDTSFAAVAQNQLVRADGQIDYSALRYLKNTLGEQSLPAIMQAMQDSRLTKPEQKEPLVDYVANYVGVNAQANQLFQAMVQDESLPLELRVNSLIGLYKVGLDHDNPGPRDMQLAQARLQVLETLRPELENEKLVQHTAKIERALLEFLNGEGRAKVPRKP